MVLVHNAKGPEVTIPDLYRDTHIGLQLIPSDIRVRLRIGRFQKIRDNCRRTATIQDYIRSSIDAARQNRYCETLFGRKLYLPNINSANQGLKSEAERVSVNMPIQGTAADLIKIAMLDIHAQIKSGDEIRMILQVHDELVFDVLVSRVEEASQIIRTAMENALPDQYRGLITLRTDIGVGRSWYEAH